MSAKPNMLGYAVLAGFAGLGIYALTRKASGAQCPPVTAERLAHFNTALDAAVVWFPEADQPPHGFVTQDGRITFPDSTRTDALQPPVIVITKGEKFWRYEGNPGEASIPEPAPDARDAFCALG